MNYKKYTQSSAFTLVELVVVATILAILSAVGFAAYTGYIAGARDTNRIVQMQDIYDGLNIYTTKGSLPLPDNGIDIVMNGNTIGYQGYAGENVLDAIGYQKGGKDPKDDTYFSYYLDVNRNYAQLLGFLEEDTSETSFFSNNTYAIEYIDRIPKTYGSSLGILTDSSNIPVQEIDTLITAGQLDTAITPDIYNAYISDTNVLSGDGDILIGAYPNLSCDRIKESKGGISDYYTISPAVDGINYRIYCDFDSPAKNLLEQNWELGSGSIGAYSQYSGAPDSEHNRIFGSTPTGTQDIVRESGSTDTNDNDGGWVNDSLSIDTSKTYRVSAWFKKSGSLNTGRAYLGTIGPITPVTTGATGNTNPYFRTGFFPELDKWFLVVGYIHPVGYTGTEVKGGIYSVDSIEKVVNTSQDYIQESGNTIGRHRAYLRIVNNPSIKQQFYDPRYEEIDPSKVGDVKDLLPVRLN